MFCDWVSQIAADEKSISDTSVTMKAGILKRAMKIAVEEADQACRRRASPTIAAGDRIGVAGEEPAGLAEQRSPRAGCRRGGSGRRPVDMIAAPTTLTKPMIAPWLKVDPGDDDDEGLADRDREQRPDIGELVADVARA